MTNRREFIVQLSLGTGVLAAGQAMAQGAALSETDPAWPDLRHLRPVPGQGRCRERPLRPVPRQGRDGQGLVPGLRQEGLIQA